MSTPHALKITLTSPPADAPEGTLATIALDCAELGLSHSGDLLRDPLTDEERKALHWYLETYWKWPYAEFRTRAKGIEQLLPEIGQRLFKALFGSAEAQQLWQPWNLVTDRPKQVVLQSTLPAVLSLPWELLNDGHGFLALRTRRPVSLIRHLPQKGLLALPLSFQPPLRVLLVTARPSNEGFVDPRGIARELMDEVDSEIEAGQIEVEFLRPPTLQTLRERLGNPNKPPIHLLHFDGHGIFHAGSQKPKLPDDGLRLRGGGQGMLAFEQNDGTADLIPAERLANVLTDSGVRLAVLTACQSAMGSEEEAFSSVAARLIQGGVDAVVAMSASVLVASAARYVEGFYRRLAEGAAVPTAHERARQALYDNPKRHPHRRRWDEEAKPVELVDWWLPHYYQQRPLTLRRQDAPTPQAATPTAPRLHEQMPEPPRYGWSGRARELHQIERARLKV